MSIDKSIIKSKRREGEVMEGNKAKELWVDMGNHKKTAMTVCAVIAVIGFAAYVFQMINGMEGYVDLRAWSIYIALFYSCAAAGAGTLFITGVFSIFGLIAAETYRRSYAMSLVAFIAASIFIMVDLGNPVSIFAMVTNPQLASPLFYDMIILPIAIIVSIVGIVVSIKGNRPKVSFGILCLISAVAVLGIESWIVVAPETKAAWGVLLGFGPSFVQSLVMALALFMIITDEYRAILKKVLALVAGFAILTIVIDALSGMGNSAMGLQMASIISSPLLWIGILIAVCGVVGQFLKGGPIQVTASLLVAVSIPLLKLALLQGGQTAGNLFGTTTSLMGFGAIEVVVSVGIIALAIFLFIAIIASKSEKKMDEGPAAAQEV